MHLWCGFCVGYDPDLTAVIVHLDTSVIWFSKIDHVRQKLRSAPSKWCISNAMHHNNKKTIQQDGQCFKRKFRLNTHQFLLSIVRKIKIFPLLLDSISLQIYRGQPWIYHWYSTSDCALQPKWSRHEQHFPWQNNAQLSFCKGCHARFKIKQNNNVATV